MKFMAEATQRLPRIEVFRAVESGIPVRAAAASGTPSTIAIMPEGFSRADISEQANNVYTLTFVQPFARPPVCTPVALEAGTGVSYICNITAVSATAVSWRAENDASTGGAPTGFHVTVIGFDSADVI